MRVRRVRAILWLATVGFILAGGIVIALALRVPTSIVAADDTVAHEPLAAIAADDGRGSPPLAQVLALCDEPGGHLRGPLYDVPPPPPPLVAPPPPPTPLAVTLAGTIIEPDAGRCRALLQAADGNTMLKRIGDHFGIGGQPGTDVELLAITPGAVQVRYGGRVVTLHVPSKASGDAAAGTAGNVLYGRGS